MFIAEFIAEWQVNKTIHLKACCDHLDPRKEELPKSGDFVFLSKELSALNAQHAKLTEQAQQVNQILLLVTIPPEWHATLKQEPIQSPSWLSTMRVVDERLAKLQSLSGDGIPARSAVNKAIANLEKTVKRAVKRTEAEIQAILAEPSLRVLMSRLIKLSEQWHFICKHGTNLAETVSYQLNRHYRKAVKKAFSLPVSAPAEPLTPLSDWAHTLLMVHQSIGQLEQEIHGSQQAFPSDASLNRDCLFSCWHDALTGCFGLADVAYLREHIGEKEIAKLLDSRLNLLSLALFDSLDHGPLDPLQVLPSVAKLANLCNQHQPLLKRWIDHLNQLAMSFRNSRSINLFLINNLQQMATLTDNAELQAILGETMEQWAEEELQPYFPLLHETLSQLRLSCSPLQAASDKLMQLVVDDFAQNYRSRLLSIHQQLMVSFPRLSTVERAELVLMTKLKAAWTELTDKLGTVPVSLGELEVAMAELKQQ